LKFQGDWVPEVEKEIGKEEAVKVLCSRLKMILVQDEDKDVFWIDNSEIENQCQVLERCCGW
jgi:hypothetical protein